MWVVTGASGFVGGSIVRALGADARGLLRQDVGNWTASNLEPQLRGMDGVLHAASVVHKPGTPSAEYDRFNVDATKALLAAATAAGVRKFVFLSSIKVHGETPSETIDEGTPIRPEGDYARTKAIAETIVRQCTSLQPVILRLCPVYGRGDKGNVRTVIQAISRRRFLVPGDGSTRKSIVHVSTVTGAAKAALESSVSGTFVIADRVAPSIRELADGVARALGRRRPVSVPAGALRGVARVAEGFSKLLRLRTTISPALVDKALLSSVCNPARAEREFGLSCHVDLDVALRDEIAWLREIGAI